MANKNTKAKAENKNATATANNGKGPKNLFEAILDHAKAKPSNGERVVTLAKERDFVCDRIADAKHDYDETSDPGIKKVIAAQLEAMRNYKFNLNLRIKALLDEE